MLRTVSTRVSLAVPEPLRFACLSAALLVVTFAVLHVLLAATYPPVHDALHDFRHALAVVPCH
ncbi:MAG TPA: CbtB-domain containing protein [candidate division Zixibacteria bacterium]|nr:CbtB-domain containing protein [candidate division Zixibacteria bacterium]